jgi:hypothetical protein
MHLDIPNDLFKSPVHCDGPINLTSFWHFLQKETGEASTSRLAGKASASTATLSSMLQPPCLGT